MNTITTAAAAAAAAARRGLRKQLEEVRAEMRAEENRAEFLRLWEKEGTLRRAVERSNRRAWARWLRHGGQQPADAGRLQDTLTAMELWRVGMPARIDGCSGTYLDLPTGERIEAPLLGDLWESARRGALA